MTRLAILADDYTGMLDTAAQFARQGIRALCTADLSLPLSGRGAQVLAFDLECRHCGPAAAYDTAYALCARLRAADTPLLYLKTDSCLRGNIGPLFSAALDVFGGERIGFAPAWPENGRVTKNGVHYVDGAPARESAAGRDLLDPVSIDRVTELLAAQGCPGARSLRVGEAPQAGDGSRVLVADAETRRELLTAGELFRQAGVCRLLAGCGGFASVLPALLPFRRDKAEPPPMGNRLLLVSGTGNANTLRQLDMAAALGFRRVFAAPERLAFHPGEIVNEIAPRLREALAESPRVLLSTAYTAGDAEDFLRACRRERYGVAAAGRRVVEALAELVSAVFPAREPPCLCIFGGDTLHALMERLGCETVEPVREVAPGVPVSVARRGGGAIPVISKSGGFGGSGVLHAICDFLDRENGGGPAPSTKPSR